MGFLPIDIAKVVYGGFNPSGSTRDPFISLGRSISHGVRPGTRPGISPVYGNTSSGYPPIDSSDLPPAAQVDEPLVQTNRDFNFNTAAASDPAQAAAQVYGSIARQSGIPDDLQPRTPNGGMLPGGMPQSREFGGTGFGNYASAQNNFIPGLVAWNGPGAANPLSGEDRVDTKHNIGALAAKFGLSGRASGDGRLPGRIK